MGFKKVLLLLILAPNLLLAGEVPDSITEIKTLLWSDGTQYVGETIDNKRNGVGAIIWQDGTRFEGEFLDDKRHGPGTMILSDGTTYTGIFEYDVLVRTELEAVEEEIAEDDVTVAVSNEQAQSNNIKQDVIDVIDNWATAWADQNEELYLSMYSQDFEPPNGLSRAEWEAFRTERINSPASIEIDLTYTSFQMISTGLIDVSFLQKYDSGSYNDETDKFLTLRLEGAEWKIILEEASPIND